MGVFKEIELDFRGRTYRLPADQILRTIAKVEDVFTLGDLARVQRQGKLPLAKLAIAYGIVLRAAGCEASDEDAYNEMFTGSGADLPRRAMLAVYTLQALMVPPPHLRAEGDEAKKPEGGEQREASSPNATS